MPCFPDVSRILLSCWTTGNHVFERSKCNLRQHPYKLQHTFYKAGTNLVSWSCYYHVGQPEIRCLVESSLMFVWFYFLLWQPETDRVTIMSDNQKLRVWWNQVHKYSLMFVWFYFLLWRPELIVLLVVLTGQQESSCLGKASAISSSICTNYRTCSAVHLSRSLCFDFNYLLSVTAGGPRSPRRHM